jgi:hypothetical protein
LPTPPLSATGSAIERIVSGALTAPSGDNSQPWRFEWDGRTLAILHDDARGRHDLNRALHSSFLTLGCLLEAVRLAASLEGLVPAFRVTLPRSPGPSPSPWAAVTFAAGAGGPDPMAAILPLRATDRRRYRGGRVDESVLASIRAESARFPNARIRFTDVYSEELLRYLAHADTFIWTHEPAHRDMMAAFRFSRREAEATRDGLPWPSLGISYPLSRLMKLSRSFTVQKALNAMGLLRKARSVSRAGITSSAALVCLTVVSLKEELLPDAGGLALAAWLRLNAHGYGVQPLTIGSLSVFDALSGALSERTRAEHVDLFRRGQDVLGRSFDLDAGEIPVWLLRTGASPPLAARARTLRRGLAEVFRRTDAAGLQSSSP